MGVVANVVLTLWRLLPSLALAALLLVCALALFPSAWDRVLRAVTAPFRDERSGGASPGWRTPARFPFGHVIQMRDDPFGFARRELDGEPRTATVFWLFWHPALHIFDPYRAKQLLAPRVTIQDTHRDIARVFPIWGKLFGQGLFMVSGDQWKRQHRIAARSFGSANTQGFLPTVRVVAARHVEALWRPGKAWLQPSEAFHPLSLEVICSIAFGLEDKDTLVRIVKLTQTVMELLASNGPLMMVPGFLHLPTPSNRTILAAIDESHDLCRALVQRHRSAAAAASSSSSSPPPSSSPDAGAATLLSVLCDAADGSDTLSDDEVVHNVFAFMIAGMDTTASALGHLVCCLASHPAVQKRLYEEVSSFATDDELLKGARYLPAVIKEVLRLFPSLIGTAPRVANEDMVFDGVTVRKGQRAVVNSLILHRSKRVWGDDAEEFKPERHLKGASADGLGYVGGSYDFTTFGGGVRPCIGRHLSLLELKVTTALLVRAYEFSHLPTTTLGPHREHPCIAPPPLLKVAPSLRIALTRRN